MSLLFAVAMSALLVATQWSGLAVVASGKKKKSALMGKKRDKNITVTISHVVLFEILF